MIPGRELRSCIQHLTVKKKKIEFRKNMLFINVKYKMHKKEKTNIN